MSGRDPFLGIEKGQVDSLGVLLLIVLTVAVSSTMVVFGSAALTDMQQQANSQRAQAFMQQFDAVAARTVLGSSDTQSISVGDADGRYNVSTDSGWLRIEHLNHSGTDDEVLYNETLGAIIYEGDDAEIAYQGGGVWRRDTDSGSVMVSPPEVHYRGITLTLPIIRVTEGHGATGPSTAVIRPISQARSVYPNASATYDGTSTRYLNPAANGSVVITVHSNYYRAWADYFRTRTETAVTVHHNNDTVVAELVTLGPQGSFDIPGENSGSVPVRGLDENHGLNDFNITLHDNNVNLDSLDFSMYVEKADGEELELNIKNEDGNDPCVDPVTVTIYYSEDSGDNYQAWQNDDTFTADCSGSEDTLTVNFTGSATVEYTPISASNLVHFDNPDTLQDPVTFDQHPVDGPTTYDSGDTENIDFVVSHYFGLVGPNFELRVDDGNNGNTVAEQPSAGTLRYGGEDAVLYLHVTENEIETDFE